MKCSLQKCDATRGRVEGDDDLRLEAGPNLSRRELAPEHRLQPKAQDADDSADDNDNDDDDDDDDDSDDGACVPPLMAEVLRPNTCGNSYASIPK